MIRGPQSARVLDADGIVSLEFNIAVAKMHGQSEAGVNGIAVAGAFGKATVADFGIAKVDEAGEAIAGYGGLALADGKRHGSAICGDNGVAVGRERGKIVKAGESGIAIAQSGGEAAAGENGIAIAKSGTAWVAGSGVAIGHTVGGGVGCLLIAVGWDTETEMATYAVGIVGKRGVQPWQHYVAHNGALVLASTLPPQDFYEA